MRFSNYSIVLQEVPGEISISFSITGCKLTCKGCHSPFLWKEGSGNELTTERFIDILSKYDGLATCVLFMGGEWHEEELIEFLKIAKNMNLKTCLYTGLEDVPTSIKKQLTFLKVGPWISELGGLNSLTTNQRFIEVETGKVLKIFNSDF